ncbi:MAG: Ig-like domain-containing protein [Saprospiraceae bacterium]
MAARFCSCGRLTEGLLWLLLANLPATSICQPADLHYLARGTGRTTGHIATLLVSNPTPMPLRTVVGDVFIPSQGNYQGYVVTQVYPLDVPPFGTVSVPLDGYCTDVSMPPVPAGAALPDVSRWVPWAAAEPLPEPGKSPAPVFYFTSAAVLSDPLALTYPGTRTPFPYRIDIHRHPQAAARLLLHAAFAAGEAFDQLMRGGQLNPAAFGKPLETQRRDLVQQSLWAYAARLQGKNYDKTAFAEQYTEEAEQQVNQPATAFSPETRQQVENQTEDLWANISLVGSAAKLVAPSPDHPTDIFRSVPTGPAVNPTDTLPVILKNTAPTGLDALNSLVPVSVFFQKNTTTPGLQDLRALTAEKWKTNLDNTSRLLDPTAKTAISDLLALLDLVQTDPGGTLSETDRRTITRLLAGKLSAHVRACAEALQPADPTFLQNWRRLKSWQNTRWYADYCSASYPLKNLEVPAFPRSAAVFSPAKIALSGDLWKHTFVPVFGTVPKKFPWWIPAVGVGGGVVYLLLRDKGSDPPAPISSAVPDAVTLPCGSQVTTNVLANDTGEGITVIAANSSTPGISISVAGTTSVTVVATGATGTFTATYTITDKNNLTTTATITITVTDQSVPVIVCPPSITLEGCGQAPPPSISGQATAVDDCAGPLVPTYSDNPPVFGGCIGTVARTWKATDPDGNTATCVQDITVVDKSAPVFTTCPPAVKVHCGQQNNLNITGQAAASDTCSGPVTVTHTDDLSVFGACEGTILRTFIAVDLCGNMTTCLQAITVVHVPCGFTPLFAFSPALCGDCNGAVSTTMSPPGLYTFEWETGDTGPNLSGLCPGPVSVTITNTTQHCTNIFVAIVPDQPTLLLTVLQTMPPTSPTSSNGRVVLQVSPTSAQLPFLVFVNGLPVSTANSHTFQITNMPAGEFEIYVVDEAGKGCPSNTVFVVLLPPGLEPPSVGGPELVFLPASLIWAPQAFLKPNLPEYPQQATFAPTQLTGQWQLGIGMGLRFLLAREVGVTVKWSISSEAGILGSGISLGFQLYGAPLSPRKQPSVSRTKARMQVLPLVSEARADGN